MRDAVLNWSARVSGQIAAEIGRDPHLVQIILQEQINALLNEVADQFEGPVTTI
jgi:cytochrome bd-type quinol oxidase subunit 1